MSGSVIYDELFRVQYGPEHPSESINLILCFRHILCSSGRFVFRRPASESAKINVFYRTGDVDVL